jgi:hypothetical protein
VSVVTCGRVFMDVGNKVSYTIAARTMGEVVAEWTLKSQVMRGGLTSCSVTESKLRSIFQCKSSIHR